MAGLDLEDLRHISWRTFMAVLELDEWAKADDEARGKGSAEDAFWGM